MKINDIITRRHQLDQQLLAALSTMDRKDTIFKVRQAILDNQKNCPHTDGNYNWREKTNICPYCGKNFS